MKKKTIIRLSITLIVIVALGLWINSRWSAWFHNEEELPYAPLSEPGRVLLTFGDEKRTVTQHQLAIRLHRRTVARRPGRHSFQRYHTD